MPSQSSRKRYLIPFALVCLLAWLLAVLPAAADTTETIKYVYDSALQLVRTVYRTGASATKINAQFDYAYDNMGNLITAKTFTQYSSTAPAVANGLKCS